LPSAAYSDAIRGAALKIGINLRINEFRRNSVVTPQIASTDENLSVLPTPFYLAEKMATRLATRQVLLRAL